jgi:hypothetical protein
MRQAAVDRDVRRLAVTDTQTCAGRPDVGLILVGNAALEPDRRDTVTGQLQAAHQPSGCRHRTDDESSAGVIAGTEVARYRLRADLLSRLHIVLHWFGSCDLKEMLVSAVDLGGAFRLARRPGEAVPARCVGRGCVGRRPVGHLQDDDD